MGPCEASGEAIERIRNYIDKTKTKLDLTMAIKVSFPPVINFEIHYRNVKRAEKI